MNKSRRGGTIGALVLACGACVMLGCNADSFFEPGTVGRWERTPTVMPILDRLSAIEDEPTEFVQSSPILPGDLLPEVDEYRLAAGDLVEVRIRDFFVVGVEESFDRALDQRGFIDLPKLPPIRAQGKTNSELVSLVEGAVRDRQISSNAVVTVNIRTQRKQTYSVLGAVSNPGTYFIPSPDFRLLEGLTSAGAVNETLTYIYVVRQVRLSDEARGVVPETEPTKKSRVGKPPSDVRAQPNNPNETPKKGEDLIELIDEMSKPKTEPKSPAAIGHDVPAAPVRAAQQEPPIQLPDGSKPVAPTQSGQGGGWVFADGKWMRSRVGVDGASVVTEQNQVTQRVIKIPVGPLLAGAADVNIVLRPGDVVRAPVPRGGLVYMTGQVARPGPYSLPGEGKLTLLRALDSAGGLNGIGIPEKVDITRVVGDGRQATMSLNVKAIGEQTQPDIYLKADDRINVGTNFWAQPLAVLRSGFRASYGFGFILDRNFQGDVFGRDAATTGN